MKKSPGRNGKKKDQTPKSQVIETESPTPAMKDPGSIVKTGSLPIKRVTRWNE